MSEIDDREIVEFEWRLTIAVRRNCECAEYLIRRKWTVIDGAINAAKRSDEDPCDVFAAFARRVHERHESGQSLTPPTAEPRQQTASSTQHESQEAR